VAPTLRAKKESEGKKKAKKKRNRKGEGPQDGTPFRALKGTEGSEGKEKGVEKGW